MKVLITGGAGFLGLHLAHFLSKKGFVVTLVDINEIDADEYPKNAKFVLADVRDGTRMTTLLKGKDVVIHAAAALPLWKRQEIFDVNIEGTRNVLSASLKNGVKHVVFISSTAVYGIQGKHPTEEDDPLAGVGPYGESKIQAEKLCEEYRRKGLFITVIRPKTFVGTHRLGVFEILFDWIRDGKRIPVIGKGENRYQLLDVSDLVEAVYLIVARNKKQETNTVFNVGAKKFGTVREDLQELFNFAKSGSKILTTPTFLVKRILWLLEKLNLSPLYKWIYETADKDSYVSVKHLTETLKWKPKYSNTQALIKAYQWYVDNYEEIKSKKAGITHTAGWKQGILGFFKKFM